MEPTYVLTGGTGGVGLGVARGLSGRVVALARNVARAREDIVVEASTSLEIVECDLASRDSIERAAAEVLERCDRIDALIGCAGVAPWKRRETVDGIELTLGTNVLGHMLLTELLRERLVASAPSRIVMISGDAHRRGRIHWDDLQLERRYNAIRAGTQAALAKIMWTYELAAELEGTGVTANTFCPGFVRSQLTRDVPAPLRALVAVGHLAAQTPERGARTPLWLTTAPELDGITGQFFRHMEVRESSAITHDADARGRLMHALRALLA